MSPERFVFSIQGLSTAAAATTAGAGAGAGTGAGAGEGAGASGSFHVTSLVTCIHRGRKRGLVRVRRRVRVSERLCRGIHIHIYTYIHIYIYTYTRTWWYQ
jgi:hypothetical protein